MRGLQVVEQINHYRVLLAMEEPPEPKTSGQRSSLRGGTSHPTPLVTSAERATERFLWVQKEGGILTLPRAPL